MHPTNKINHTPRKHINCNALPEAFTEKTGMVYSSLYEPGKAIDKSSLILKSAFGFQNECGAVLAGVYGEVLLPCVKQQLTMSDLNEFFETQSTARLWGGIGISFIIFWREAFNGHLY